MKTNKILIALSIVLLLLGTFTIVVVAEEIPTEEVVETETTNPTEEEFISSDLGKYFNTEVKPYLIDAGTSLLGFIASCCTLLVAIKKFLNAHKTEINEAVDKVKNTVEDEVKSFKEEIKQLKEENEELKKQNAILYEDASKVKAINEDITRLKNCFSIIACNDPKLVSNGQAKYIAEELGTNEENIKEEQVSI